MIRLKSLLEQSQNVDNDNIPDVPQVLFLGDGYTKSKSSYANQLINSNSISGRVVAWPMINIKQLVKLAKRYIKDEYTIVSVLFGDIVTKNIPIDEFKQQLLILQQTVTSKGAQLVVIGNPINLYKNYEEYLDEIDDMGADLIIQIGDNKALNSKSTQVSIANSWIDDVSSTFDLNLNDVPVDSGSETPDDQNVDSAEKQYNAPSTSILADYSDSIVNQAYDLIIPFEGFTATAKIDTDGYCRIGHGSMHITKENGTVIDLGKPDPGKSCAETYTYVIDKEDAHRDLRRLIPDSFLPTVEKTIKKWGGDITKLNDATVAVLVSVAYNYGHIPGKLKAGIVANDAEMIGNALLNNFNSHGENPSRRKKEGQYILNSLEGESLWGKAKDYISNKFNRKGSGGSVISFSPKAKKDLDDNVINPNLIDDLRKAAEAAGVTIKIGTAKTGHDIYTSSGHRSRHADGLAVDIIEVNGLNWNTKDHAIEIGAYLPAEAFSNELQNLGYALNNEYNMDKAILTFGFKDHNDHIHVSRKS